jgi:RNA polymerase subunit RPABC4/transcription elongation factor Spt4
LFQDAKGAFQDKDYNTAVGLSGETIDLVDELVARFKPKTPTQAAVPAKPATQTPTQVTMALADNKCPKCGMSVKNTWEICPACNAPLRTPTPATAAQKICPKCGKPVKDRWTICPFCESPLK